MSRTESGGMSLLIRNVSFNSRTEDLRYVFEKFGEVRDVYIPKDHKTGYEVVMRIIDDHR